MTWKMILLGLFKGILAVFAEEYDIRMRQAKRAKAPPPKEAPPPEPTMGWGPPSPPPPATVIRVETEQGSQVSSASFVGSEFFGSARVTKERQPGESRRTRRKTRKATPESTDKTSAVSTNNASAASAETAAAAPPDEAKPGRTDASERPPGRTRGRRRLTDLSESTLTTLARGGVNPNVA